MTIIVESGTPNVTGMQFILNTDGVDGVGGWKTEPLTAFSSGRATLDLNTTVGINWASSYVQLGVLYPNTAPFTFSIELANAAGVVVYDKTGLVSGGTDPSGVAPIFTPKPEGQGLTVGMFENLGNREEESSAIGGITKTLKIDYPADRGANWRWSARISFADLGITSGNYSVEITYFVPTASATRTDVPTQLQIGTNTNGGVNSGITMDSGVERFPQIAKGAWTTHTISFTANPFQSGWNAANNILTIQPDGGGFDGPWYISSIKVTKNYDLCSNIANHAGLTPATCTATAQVCSVQGCGHYNGSQIAALGHAYRSISNTQHDCSRTGCTLLANHTTSTVGQQCSLCNHTIQAHDCVFNGTPVVYTGVTCTSAGTRTVPCSVTGCPNVQTSDHAAFGHNLVNNVCTRCNLTPCGICGVVGDWSWGGNEGSHWAVNCKCDGFDPDYLPHWFNANGVCVCGATGTPSPNPSPCGMCRTVGVWSWGGNEDVHWSTGTCCTAYASHSYDSNGRCICGRTGTPSAPPSACGMCRTVGVWSWGGNADVHWSNGDCCTDYEPHSFDANGRCRCGRTGTPGSAVINPMINSPCGMCGVVGAWIWGGNADTHWADNCNCSGSEPHVYDSNGRCKCGATAPGAIAAPQDSFRAEDFIDTEALLDDLRRAIAAGEVPTIDLTESGNVTIISAEVLHEIARLGVDVKVVLQSGFTFTIIASSITGNVGAFDLNIDVLIKHEDVQLTTVGGGLVDISKNSIVFMPNFHGEFGFEIVFNITADQLDHAGIDAETAKRFHVCGVGNVTDHGEPALHDDGSLSFPISHASFHVLSSEPPLTAEVGAGFVNPEVPESPNVGGPVDTRTYTEIQQSIEQHAENAIWILIIIAGAAIIAASSVAIVIMRRRQNTKGA